MAGEAPRRPQRGCCQTRAPPRGDPGAHPRLPRRFAECLVQIRQARVPVIACVAGKVMGGGVGLVAACDMVLATPETSFMLPEVIVGLVPALTVPFLRLRV